MSHEISSGKIKIGLLLVIGLFGGFPRRVSAMFKAF